MKRLYLILSLLGSFAALAMDVPETEKQEEGPKIILRNINNKTDNDFTIHFPFGETSWLKKNNIIRKHKKKQFNVEIPITWAENQESTIDICDQDNNRIQLRFLLLLARSGIKPSTHIFKVLLQSPPENGVTRAKREQLQGKPGFFKKHNVLTVDITLQGTSPYFKSSSINIIPIASAPTLAEITVRDMAKRIIAGEYTLESLKGKIPIELIEKIEIEFKKLKQ